jgi:hypothetical protein
MKLKTVPKFNDNTDDVRFLQDALNLKGAGIKVDGHFGPRTRDALSAFQRSRGLVGSGVIPKDGGQTFKFLGLELEKQETAPQKKGSIPWFWAAKKHEGKVETNSAFSTYLSKYWGKAGLPSFNGISGSSKAWCGLFVVYALSVGGYSYHKMGATAKSWDSYGQSINWRVNGFPQGAIIRINSKSNCKSAAGNHVTFANGDCSAADLVKAGATFSGMGGNQKNSVRISNYAASRICSVRWPSEVALPAKVTKSVNCSNGKASNESTR